MRVIASIFHLPVSRSLFAAFALLVALSFTAPAAQAQSLGYEGPTASLLRRWLRSQPRPPRPGTALRCLSLPGWRTCDRRLQHRLDHRGFAKRFEWVTPARFTPVRTPMPCGTTISTSSTARPSFCRRTPLKPSGFRRSPWRNLPLQRHDAYDGPPRHKQGPPRKTKGTAMSIWWGPRPSRRSARRFRYCCRPVCAAPMPRCGVWAATLPASRRALRRAGPGLHRPRQERHHRGFGGLAAAAADQGGQASALDIPTSEVYAVRIVPLPKYKLNFDGGILHAGGNVGGLNLDARARVAFGISYGF